MAPPERPPSPSRQDARDPGARAPLLVRCSARLRADLGTLLPAYVFCRGATRRFLQQTDGSLYHEVTALYAAWVHFAFAGDEAAYLAALGERLARRDPYSPLSGLLFADIRGGHWGWAPPEDEAGASAVRLIDRIDLGLNYLRRHLGVALPEGLRTAPESEQRGAFSIRGGSNEDEREALLVRAAHFAEAAWELFGEP